MASSYPSVRVETGPVFETVAELAAFSSGPARPSLESGKGWVRRVRQLAGPDLIRRVEQWAFPLYTELASIALEAGPPFEAKSLSARLRATKPQALQRRLLGAESPPNRAMVSDGAFDRALRGDRSAQAELKSALGLNPEARAGLDRLFATPPGRLRKEISAIVDGWAERVSPAFAQDSIGLVERDAESKLEMLRASDPRDALREFTNGVDVDPAGWASQIVVIPAVALRPFIAPVEWQSTLVLVVSVADEVVDTVAGGPPRRLIKAAAALGDELRLRILHELGNGDRSATELADLLGVERTSLHHHLGILRSAGLVAVAAESDQVWRYSLRKDGLDGVSAALSSYLGP